MSGDVPHRLRYLNSWCSVGGVWGILSGSALLEKVHHPGLAMRLKNKLHLQLSLCFMFVVQTARHQRSVSVTNPIACCHTGLFLLRTISPNKLVLLLAALVMVSYYRDRRVANAGGKQVTGHITGARVRG